MLWYHARVTPVGVYWRSLRVSKCFSDLKSHNYYIQIFPAKFRVFIGKFGIPWDSTIPGILIRIPAHGFQWTSKFQVSNVVGQISYKLRDEYACIHAENPLLRKMSQWKFVSVPRRSDRSEQRHGVAAKISKLYKLYVVIFSSNMSDARVSGGEGERRN